MKRFKDILKLHSVRVVLLYILLSALWIAFTDQIVEYFFQEAALITQIQTFKGWLFVLVSGLFVYWILRTSSHEITRNRDYYKTMLDDAKVGLARIVDGQIISANPAFLRILQIEESGIQEESFLNFIDMKNREQIIQILDRLEFEEQEESEMRLSFGANRKRWVQFIFSRHRDKNGGYYQVIAQDINTRKTYQSYNDLLLQLILSLEPGLDFESSLRRMLKNLCTELNWEYGIALTPGVDSQFKKQVSWYRLDPLLDEFDSRVDLYRFAMGEGLTGMTAKYRKAIWIENVEKTDHYKYRTDAMDADLRTIIAIPVVSNEEVLAVIVLFNRQILKKDRDLIKLLTAIGQDMASKLEKSREQDERQRLEQSLNFALRAANMATWDMDLKSGEVLRSLNHHELFGLSEAPEKWNVNDLLERIFRKDREKVHEKLMNAATGNEEYNVEFRMKLNGEMRWFWSRGNLQLDEFGEPERLTGVISDITNKKKIEKELERERELLESLYKTIPVMITIYRPDLSEFRVNKEFERVTGWSNEEVAVVDLMKEVYPDPSYRKMVSEFMSKPGSGWKDIEMVIRSGDKIHSTWTNLRLSDDTQIGIGLDITERKNYEMEIRNKERLLIEAQRVANLGTFTLDLLTGDASASEELSRIFGFEPDREITLDDWRNSLHPDHKEEVEQYLERIIKKQQSFDKEYLIRRQSDGEARWVHGKGEIILNDRGEPVKMIGTIQDIDGRKSIEQNLKEERLRFEAAAGVVSDVVWDYDVHKNTLWWNEGIETVFGYDREKILNDPDFWDNHIYKEDKKRVIKSMREAENSNSREWHESYRFLDSEGNPRHVEDSAIIIRNDQGELLRIIGAMVDITEQKKAEDRIIGSIIEGSENERRRIAKELHDGFGQYLAAASMNLESTYEEIKGISGRSWEQYKKGLKLLDDAIIESRRMSQNLLPKAIEDFGLSLATESMLDDLNASTDFEINYSDNIADMSLPENVELNMYRIIQEGVNNAIRHSNCTRLSIQLIADEDSLGCTIEDNGSGFEIGEEENYGLGLQSIENRVKSMAGEVEFSSRLGKGTLISVIVPLNLL